KQDTTDNLKRNLDQPCLSTGKVPLSLDVPQEFMDNLPKIEEWLRNEDSTKMAVEGSDLYGCLSLDQKLKGWTIELRRRRSTDK
ncbi:hypothetical protein LINPERHAP2_LOCUS37010, partial [Linum perenne]